MNNNYNNLSIINNQYLRGNNNKRKVYTLHLVIIINNIISKVFLYTRLIVHTCTQRYCTYWVLILNKSRNPGNPRFFMNF